MPRPPRVRCAGCAFAWFGPTAEHGLRIIGTCPRCGGELDFLVPAEGGFAPDADLGAEADARTPAAVLGPPPRR